jgi:NitT/TauT family transport system substrate-binding protein
MATMQTRRRFLTTLSLAGAAGLVRTPQTLATEGVLETTSVRLPKGSSICTSPQYIVEELLRAEGFTDIRYVEMPADAVPEAIGHGKLDFALNYATMVAVAIDRGEPLTVLAGVHVGCFELFANGPIHGIADLKGKTVGVTARGYSDHLFVSVMAAHVGLNPGNDIHWIVSESPTPAELFADSRIDACLGLPPVAQDLRARHVGRVVVNSATDHPWSQYFCCMLYGNSGFIRKYPTATKRVTRAILRATDICATDPARVAKLLVDGGFTDRYDYALQTLSELPYDKWREFDAEDSIRFFALRLHEAGLIKSPPNKIIADGTDWRFLNELKRELKA